MCWIASPSPRLVMRGRTSISKGVVAAGIACAISLNLSVRAADSGNSLENVEHEVCAVYDATKDAVVKVHAERTLPLTTTPLPPVHRIGTGFFIRNNGVLL